MTVALVIWFNWSIPLIDLDFYPPPERRWPIEEPPVVCGQYGCYT